MSCQAAQPREKRQNDAISLIPKEIKFGIEFLCKKHLKSNKKRSFDTLEGRITGSNEEKVIWK